MLIQLSALSDASVAIGWAYFAAWSISFWPQVILNYRRKRVTGLSFEFLAYNVTGFLCYSVYSTVKYFIPNACGDTVEINDLAFGYHATTLTLITILQCILYKTKTQKVHPIHAFLCASMWVIIGYTVILCLVVDIPFLPHCHSYLDKDGQPVIITDTNFSLIDLMGYIKAAVSLIKYVPQVYLNWSRQSTTGWSIGNVFLDFTGGVLSFTQQGLDSVIQGSTEPITGNIPKLLLAIESLLFDVIFMVQHYVLYKGKKPITQQGQEEEEKEEEAEKEEEEEDRQGEERGEGQGEGSREGADGEQKKQKQQKNRASRGGYGQGEQIEGRAGSGAGVYPSTLPVRVGEEGSYHQLNDVNVQDDDDDYILEPGLYHSSIQYPQPRHPAAQAANTSSFSASRYPQPHWTPSPQQQQQQQPYPFRPGMTNNTTIRGTYASPWPIIERR